MNKNFIVFGRPDIQLDEINEVRKTLESGWLGTGPKVHEFEKLFAQYIGVKYSVAVSSCTAALHLSLLSMGLKQGDEVLTTALTFCSTVNSIIHAGYKPVLVDVNPDTMNMDINDLKMKISKKSKIILPVHFAGRPCDMNDINTIAEENSLEIIEDCAHSIESEYYGGKTGSFGKLGCFSFYVTKNLVTGEGGMISTNSKQLAKKIKVLSLHGLSADAWSRFSDKGYKHYLVEQAGFKYNMMDIQAAIGIHQLNRIEKNWKKRQSIWNIYIDAFKNLPIKLPIKPEKETKHAYHLFTILINKKKVGISRDHFINRMTKKGIGVGVHYLSIPEHPYYKKTYNWAKADTPIAWRIGRETVSLPISTNLTNKNIDRIIEAVRYSLKK
jgi:dTDP-4-amino-4,6-dideoxygalactose transaminase